MTNSALARPDAAEWEGQAPTRDEAAIQLTEAMASDAELPRFRARAELSRLRRTDSFEVQQATEYEGAELIAQVLTLRNLGSMPVDLAVNARRPPGRLRCSSGLRHYKRDGPKSRNGCRKCRSSLPRCTILWRCRTCACRDQ